MFPSTELEDDEWRIYAESSLEHFYLGKENKLFEAFNSMLIAYSEGDAEAFNSNLEKYNTALQKKIKERNDLIEKQISELDGRRAAAKDIESDDLRKNEETAIHVEERRLGREKQKWMSSIHKTGFEVKYNKFSPFFT